MVNTVKVGNHTIPAVSCEYAICKLAGVCDFASSWDGQGFSKYDAKFGHSLADSVIRYGRFTPKQLAVVQRSTQKGDPKDGLILKYKKQLTKMGFDIASLLKQQPIVDTSKLEAEFHAAGLTVVDMAGVSVPAPKQELQGDVEPDVLVKAVQIKDTKKAVKLEIEQMNGTISIWLPKVTAKSLEYGYWEIKGWKANQIGLHPHVSRVREKLTPEDQMELALSDGVPEDIAMKIMEQAAEKDAEEAAAKAAKAEWEWEAANS